MQTDTRFLAFWRIVNAARAELGAPLMNIQEAAREYLRLVSAVRGPR